MKTKITCEKTFVIQEDDNVELCLVRVTKHDTNSISFKVVCCPNFLIDDLRMDKIIEVLQSAKEWSLNPE